jgi:type I restriction enzyme S subunit
MKSRFPIVELGKHVRQISQRNRAEADVEVFSVTNSEGFTRSTDYFRKEVFSKDVSNYKIVSPGQFAYNPSRINVGSIDYLRHDNPVLVSPLYIVFEGNNDLHADYLLRYLKSGWGNAQIRANTEGAVRDSLKFKGLESINLPLPPLDDQIRIAYLLGKVEELIARRKQHLQQLDDLLKSVFQEMFGDPVRNEKGWDRPEFQTLISGMRNGLSPSKSGTHQGRVYTLSAITGNRFREIYKEDSFSQIHQKYFPASNDFLLCRGNGNLALVGKGYFFPAVSTDVIFPDTIIAVSIQPEAIDRAFLEALWKTMFIRQQIESNARTTNGAHKINQGVIEKLTVLKPPIGIQKQYAVIAKEVEGIKCRYHQNLTDLEALYGVLSQQAFKGELDLSQVALPAVPIEGESHVAAAVPVPITTPVIELPENDLLLPALQDRTQLAPLLRFWLEAYRSQLCGAVFSLDRFIVAAQTRLGELHPDSDFELRTSDYEIIKAWVFEALASGHLQQSQNITGYEEEGGKPIFGNLIELEARQA